ncbi:LysE family transporter, partial [Actinomadura adrarensis]
DTLYAAAALLGGTALAYAIQPVLGPMRWTAAAVLIALALHMLLRVRKTPDPPDGKRPALNSLGTPLRAYLGFLGMTLLNPWAIIYFAALALIHRHDGELTTMLAFTAGVFIASLTWQLFLALGGNVLGRVIASPRGRLVTTTLSSLIIVVLATVMVAAPPK